MGASHESQCPVRAFPFWAYILPFYCYYYYYYFLFHFSVSNFSVCCPIKYVLFKRKKKLGKTGASETADKELGRGGNGCLVPLIGFWYVIFTCYLD